MNLSCPACGSDNPVQRFRNVPESHGAHKPRTQQPKPISNRKLRRLLKAADADVFLTDLHDALILVSSTGLRLHELTELFWSDVNLATGQIVVRSQPGHIRLVPFDSEARLILGCRQLASCGCARVFGNVPTWTAERLKRQLRELCEREGVRRICFHAIRRMFCLKLLKEGTPSEQVMSIMGSRRLLGLFSEPRNPQVPSNAVGFRRTA